MVAHAGSPSCERCVVEVQLEYAFAAAERLRGPDGLIVRLTELGGPAPVVYCGYAQWSTDPLWDWEQFCELPKGHEGKHRAGAA